MTTRTVQVRRGDYHDSVGLMQVSTRLRALPGVESALVAMGTELNLDLLDTMGFERPAALSPNDMVVAVATDSDETAAAALQELDLALSDRPHRSTGAADEIPPPTLTAAVRRTTATLALVSTPGRVAAIDAADALAAGLDVMIFSDNVTVEQEVALKDLGAATGRLVMGPDCGTAVMDGLGLGFANVVRPGPVGIVAASGTGAQHLMALLDASGVGVSHCLGVGGRDLSAQVGGQATLMALDRLEADDTVTAIVVVSKPPDATVADTVRRRVAASAKPTVLGYLGAGRPDLTEVARQTTALVAGDWSEPRRWGGRAPTGRSGYLRGLFTGGTLCDEAMLVATDRLGPVASNIPLEGGRRLGDDLGSDGHTFVDFGDDRLTAGRPHPMIDPSLRLGRLEGELADSSCGVVLLDVVLGHAAHDDPAAGLVPVVRGSAVPVVVSLVGTRDDPQGLESTAQRLVDAGAIVHASNAAAAREAVALISRDNP